MPSFRHVLDVVLSRARATIPSVLSSTTASLRGRASFLLISFYSPSPLPTLPSSLSVLSSPPSTSPFSGPRRNILALLPLRGSDTAAAPACLVYYSASLSSGPPLPPSTLCQAPIEPSLPAPPLWTLTANVNMCGLSFPISPTPPRQLVRKLLHPTTRSHPNLECSWSTPTAQNSALTVPPTALS